MLIVGSRQHRPLHIWIPPKVTSAASSVAAIARVIVVVLVIAGVVEGLGIDGRANGGVKGQPPCRQNITENGISTVYQAFYASKFPATSEPLLNLYSTLILAN
jgi:hypothetical protein